MNSRTRKALARLKRRTGMLEQQEAARARDVELLGKELEDTRKRVKEVEQKVRTQ